MHQQSLLSYQHPRHHRAHHTNIRHPSTKNTFHQYQYPTRNNNIGIDDGPSSPLLLQQQQIRQFARSTRRGGMSSPNNKRSNKGKFDKYSFEDGTKLTGKNSQSSKKDDKNILVIGSCGILGNTLVKQFDNKKRWNVVGADILDPNDLQTSTTTSGGGYVHLPSEGSLADLTSKLYTGVQTNLLHDGAAKEITKDGNKLDAIIVASGGWAGDVDIATIMERHLSKTNELEDDATTADGDVEEEIARESAMVCERMMRMNYFPIVAGGLIGRRFMKRGGKSMGMYGRTSCCNDGLCVLHHVH